MQLSRRSLFGALGAGALMHTGRLRATTTPLVLRAPRLGEPRHRRLFGGFRPVRSNGFRLDIADLAEAPNRIWINNYGHGGGGITLSWGCAEQVVEWVGGRVAATDRPLNVVVLGAGVIGLTTAKLLTERFGDRCSVEIHADKITGRKSSSRGIVDPGTTSDNAGGQFEPSFYAFRSEANAATARQTSAGYGYVFSDDEIVRLSYNRFTRDAAQARYAVSMLPNYMTVRANGGEVAPPSNNNLIRTKRALAASTPRIPSVGGYLAEQAGPVSDVYIASPALPDGRRGIPCNYMIPTLLVEVPKLMGWLRTTQAASLKSSHFQTRADVLNRFADADVIVNCLGCDGAMIAGGVNDISPTLGVVLGLPSLYTPGAATSTNTHYLYGGLGYIFARADCTIVGGWKKEMAWSRYRGQDLVQTMRDVGRTLDYYMDNFVNGRRSKANVLECFTNDQLSISDFDVLIDPDEFLEMDGLHRCNVNPIKQT